MIDTDRDPFVAGVAWLYNRTADEHLAHVLDDIARQPVYAALEHAALAGDREALDDLTRSLIILSHGTILEGLADVIGLEGALAATHVERPTRRRRWWRRRR